MFLCLVHGQILSSNLSQVSQKQAMVEFQGFQSSVFLFCVSNVISGDITACAWSFTLSKLDPITGPNYFIQHLLDHVIDLWLLMRISKFDHSFLSLSSVFYSRAYVCTPNPDESTRFRSLGIFSKENYPHSFQELWFTTDPVRTSPTAIIDPLSCSPFILEHRSIGTISSVLSSFSSSPRLEGIQERRRGHCESGMKTAIEGEARLSNDSLALIG